MAEGIETEAQHARLRGMGCDLGQGYLYARPVDAEAVTPLLASVRPLAAAPGFVATAGRDRVYRDAWSRLPDVSVASQWRRCLLLDSGQRRRKATAL